MKLSSIQVVSEEDVNHGRMWNNIYDIYELVKLQKQGNLLWPKRSPKNYWLLYDIQKFIKDKWEILIKDTLRYLGVDSTAYDKHLITKDNRIKNEKQLELLISCYE